MQEKSSYTSTLSLPSEREIRMTRVFDAPRELVFKAHTDPKLLAQWWGQRNNNLTVDRMDVRPGGQWRYVEREADGTEFAFHGEYREIVPPERLVSTFEYEGMPGHVAVDTAVFEELPGGKTRLTTTSSFASQEDRDGMLASGMEGGANESWDKLGELLARS
jgi:uncharacterized protein YndB with AHSA1/START domain